MLLILIVVATPVFADKIAYIHWGDYSAKCSLDTTWRFWPSQYDEGKGRTDFLNPNHWNRIWASIKCMDRQDQILHYKEDTGYTWAEGNVKAKDTHRIRSHHSIDDSQNTYEYVDIDLQEP